MDFHPVRQMQVKYRAFKKQGVNQERKLARGCFGIQSRQAEGRSKLIDFCCAALPVDELRNHAAERELQGLLGIIFMCSSSRNRSRARKDTHCKLLEECLLLSFSGAAEQVADLLRTH